MEAWVQQDSYRGEELGAMRQRACEAPDDTAVPMEERKKLMKGTAVLFTEPPHLGASGNPQWANAM
eukprot:6619304-Lingulodinium_polyedra.AAC.1